jgi:hypothetical protein
MRKCEICGYHLDMHSELCDRMQKVIARAEKAEAERDELKKLSSHGNGEILLGWMDAHKKAMDRLEKAEAENARLRDYIITVAKFAADLGYQSGHDKTVAGNYAPPSECDYDIFDGIDLMEVGS